MSNLRAIGLVVTAMVFWSTQDVIVKFTAGEVSLWQMQLVRSVAVITMLALLLLALGRIGELWPSAWRWPLVRGVFMSISYLAFYAALPYVSLAKAASAFFISPMLITVLAAIFLGEGIGPRRIAAVIVGFVGVLFIVQPGFEGWTPYTLLPVGAAMGYSVAVVLTRWRCQAEPGYALTAVNNLVNVSIGALGIVLVPLLAPPPEMQGEHAFLQSGWLAAPAAALALVVLTGLTHIVGALASVRAYQIGEASRLAPFEYTYLVMMGLYGYAIWGTVPDRATLIGMALICGAGGFIAWREGRPARPRMHQSAEIPWTPAHLDPDPSWPEPAPESAPSRNW